MMNGPASRLTPDIVGVEALTASENGSGSEHARPWKIAAVIPCFNRRGDLETLLRDVIRQDVRPVAGRSIQLWCVVLDNASTEPLSTIRVPDGLVVEFVRLEHNSGGSGGFNAAMSHVLSGAGLGAEMGQADFLWWLDSDARAGRRCLRELLRVMARDPRIGVIGSGMRDRATGRLWEVGGRIVPQGVRPAGAGDLDRRYIVYPDYVAACSALVRRAAIEKTGLFPENFIYYDDVDWCIQMKRKTGMRIAATSRSAAWHPPGDRRYSTWGRYYIARNCYSHIDVMGKGGLTRAIRALFEVPRAVGQTMMGLDELAALHLRGLSDAAEKKFPAVEPKDVMKPLGFRPFKELKSIVDSELAAHGSGATLYVHPLLKSRLAGFEPFRKELKSVKFTWPRDRRRWKRRTLAEHVWHDFFGAAWRLVAGPTADVAIVPTGWPTSWFRGRTLVQVTTEGLLVRKPERFTQTRKAVGVLFEGVRLAARLCARGPHIMQLPPAPHYRPRQAPVVAEATPVAAT